MEIPAGETIPPRKAIDLVVEKARAEEADLRAGELDERDLEGGDHATDTVGEPLTASLTVDFARAIAELSEIRCHRCSFTNGIGYCPICGREEV